MSKVDQIRELRERQAAERETKPKPLRKKPDVANSMANAKAAMANTGLPVEKVFLHPNEMHLAKEFPGHEVVEVKPIGYRYRDPEKRRAYQRDLMRKKRAKAKG